MIIGTGADIAEVKRIARALEQPGFAEKVFTPAEIAYCRERKSYALSFAARWAAKEAVAKALGTGIGPVGWRDAEVAADKNGKPEMFLSGAAAELARSLGVTRVHLSLSHSDDYAIAFVVLESE